jgi:predicted nucleotidyltransferase component of viral defense system
VRLPTDANLVTYAERVGVDPDVARRDYVLLRIAEAMYRDPEQHNVYVAKGAFVLHFVFGSYRASKDIDGIVGTRHDAVDPVRLRQLILRGIGDDFEIHVPRRGAKEPRADSITFAPITFASSGLGNGSVEIELSLREELVYPAVIARIVVPEFDLDFLVTHIDLDEQVAEKMRCLAQRSKVPDAYDVWWLWTQRAQLHRDRIRAATTRKLTSTADHRELAFRRLAARERAWDNTLEILPRELPAKADVFRDCHLALAEWMP